MTAALPKRPHDGVPMHRAGSPTGQLSDRQPTLLLRTNFDFIQGVQRTAAANRDLPAIDHGLLASAALAIVADIDRAPQQIIDRALQMMLERHRAAQAA